MTDAPVRATRRTLPRLCCAISGFVLLAMGAVGVAAHYSDFVSTTWTLIASFTPLLILVTGLAVLLLLIGRRRLAAVAAVAVLALGGWTQLPLYRATAAADVAGDVPNITVMQANIFLGQADTDSLLAEVRDHDVDVLTVAELTEGARDNLVAAGIDGELPYSYTRPRDGGGGTGIFSRYPLTDGQSLPGFVLENLRATLTVPGAAPTTVYALHPLPPFPEPSFRWMTELREIRRLLAEGGTPVVIGADFNSTYDHRQYRQVLDGAGAPPLRDAAEFVGAGIVPTYPADRWYPAVLAIDRILTRGGTPLSFSRFALPGSDHHGVVSDIRLDGTVDS